MSSSVEKRVVEMRFENGQFERGAKESMSTLDKLKEKLKIGTYSKDVDLSQVEKSVEVVGHKFSWLEEIAKGALRRIGERAHDIGAQITKSLTIEPILDGYSEYQNKMDSIQTILTNTASKGTTIDDVNKALDELNGYADKTVYSFADMTKAIGQFTTAGIGVEEATTAIKGFSNLAAGVGANNEMLTRAEYQLSQALASGNMYLMDWKSMENAGMGGEFFQKGLIETAKEYYKNNEEYLAMLKQIESKEMSFRESLNKRSNGFADWLNADVIMDTLKRFSEDPALLDAATKVRTITQMFDTLKEALGTGWASSLEIVVGNYEEASELLTKISNALSEVFLSAGAERNKMLKEWKDLGGRDDLIEALSNSWHALQSFIKPIKEAFREIFPPMTGKNLADITAAFKEFTTRIGFTKKEAADFKEVVKAILTPFKSLITIIQNSWPLISSLGKGLGMLVGWLLKLIVSMSKLPSLFKLAIGDERYARLVNALAKSLGALIETVIFGGKIIAGFITGITEAFANSILNGKIKDWLIEAVDALTMFFEKMSNPPSSIGAVSWFGNLKDTIEIIKTWDIKNIYDKIIQETVKFGDHIGGTIKNIFSGIWSFISNLHVAEVIVGIFQKIGEAIGSFLSKLDAGQAIAMTYAIGLIVLFKKIGSAFGSIGDIFENISDILANFGGAIKAWANNQNATAVIKVAGAIGILAASLLALSLIEPKKLAASALALMVVAKGLAAIMVAFFLFSQLKDKGGAATRAVGYLDIIAVGVKSFLKSAGVALKRATFMLFAIGVAILAGSLLLLKNSLEKIAELDTNKVLSNLNDYVIVFGSLTALAILGRKTGAGTFKLGVGLVSMVAGIKMFVTLIKSIADMDIPNLKIKPIISVMTGVVLGFGVLMKASANTGKYAIQFGISTLAMAGTMKILTFVMKDLAKMTPSELTRTSLVIGGAMAMFSLLEYASSFTGTAKASAILAMGLAVLALSGSLAVLTLLDTTKLLASSIALGEVMIALGAVFTIVSQIKIKKKAVMALAGAMIALGAITVALAALASYDWQNILSAGTSLSEVLLSISGSLVIMSKVTAVANKALISAGILVLITYALSVPIMWLATQDFNRVVGAAIALSSTLVALSGALLIMGSIGQAATAAMEGAAIVLLFMAVLDLIVVGVGALVDKFPALEIFVDKGIDILCKLGEGFGRIIGSYIGGISEGSMSAIGKGLSAFSDNAVPFFDKIKGFSEESVLGLKNFASAILTLSAASFIDGIARLIGLGSKKTLGALGRELSEFGQYFAEYSNAISDVKMSRVESSMAIAQSLVELSKSVPYAGGLLSLITGKKDLVLLAQGLVEFGHAMKEYAESVKGIDAEVVENSTNAAMAIAEFATNVPNSGGLLGLLVGNNDLADFAKGLVPFGKEFKMYAMHMKHVNSDVVIASSNAVKSVMEFARLAPNSGGLLGLILGNNDLSKIGEELREFGKDFASYSRSAKIINSNIESVNSVTRALRNLFRELRDTKQIDVKKLRSIMSEMKELGKYTAEGYAKGVDDNSKKASDATRKMARTASKSARDELRIKSPSKEFYEIGDYSVQGFIKPFTDKKNDLTKAVTDFSAQAVNAVSSNAPKIQNEFSKMMNGAMTGFDPKKMQDEYAKMLNNTSSDFGLSKMQDEIKGVMTDVSANEIVNTYKNLGKDAAAGYNNEFTSVITDGQTDINNMLNSIGEEMKIEGIDIGNQLASGLDQSKSAITNSVFNAGNEAVNAWGNHSSEFYNKSSESGQNIVNGISDKIPDMRNIAQHFGEEMVNGITPHFAQWEKTVQITGRRTKETFIEMLDRIEKEHKKSLEEMKRITGEELESPKYRSRIEKAGNDVADGFAKGITNHTDKPKSAAEKIAGAFLDSLKKKLDSHSPSKEAEKIGVFTIEGFVLGLRKLAVKVGDEAKDIGTTALDSMNNAISAITDKISDDTTPVISPVLDLSNIETGIGRMDSLLSADRSFKMASDNSFGMREAEKLAMTVEGMSFSDTAMVNAINNLHDEMSVMLDRLGKLQIVMDSGALVGQLASPIDSALGMRTFRNWREREA